MQYSGKKNEKRKKRIKLTWCNFCYCRNYNFFNRLCLLILVIQV